MTAAISFETNWHEFRRGADSLIYIYASDALS